MVGASNSLFRIRLGIPMEYMPMINDLLRMSCIQLVAQYMFYMVNSEANPFFSVMFVQTICFLLLGVLVYWLIVTKLFSIETTDTVLARKASDKSGTRRRKIAAKDAAAESEDAAEEDAEDDGDHDGDHGGDHGGDHDGDHGDHDAREGGAEDAERL